jgi:hypothetical protein
MARINDTTEYPNTTPALNDHVPGTDVSTGDDATVTFLLSEILNLYKQEIVLAVKDAITGKVAEWGTNDVERYLSVSGERLQIGYDTVVAKVIAGAGLGFEIEVDGGTKAAFFKSDRTLELEGAVEERVQAVTGTTPTLRPSIGTIATWTLSGNSTPTIDLNPGESLTLFIDDGTGYTITWPTMEWAGGSAPTLATTGYTGVVLTNIGGTVYGVGIGDFS